MDRFNYIAWVDNVCQKFEDVCLEVDNIRPEEIIGAAETQLQTMGASITKFFSDLVDDVVPQRPADHVVEEEVSDLSPVQKDSEVSMDDGHCEKVPFFPHLKQNNGVTVHEKSRMIIRRNPIKEKENQLESLDIHEKKDSVTTALSLPLDNDPESSDILEKKDSITRLTTASSPPLDNTESLDILEKKDSVMAALSLPLEISNESLDILEKKDPVMEALSSALDDDTESNSGAWEGGLYADSSSLMGSHGSEILDIEVALNVSLTESTGDSVDDVRKVELETIQPLTKARLDESCIMVDSSELCAVSRDVRRSRSDKEKKLLRLKSIFALRKKVGDWECDHSHLDVGCYQQKGKGGKGLAAYGNSELLDDGFSESEWEII